MSIDEVKTKLRSGWTSLLQSEATKRRGFTGNQQAAGLSDQNNYRTPLLPAEVIFRKWAAYLA